MIRKLINLLFKGDIAPIGRAGVLHTQGYGFNPHYLHNLSAICQLNFLTRYI